MSSAFKQSLHPDYLMVEHKARERSFDSRQSRRGDDDDVNDSIVHDVLTPPDFKVCDTLKLKQVRESVLDMNAAYYRIRTHQPVCNSVMFRQQIRIRELHQELNVMHNQMAITSGHAVRAGQMSCDYAELMALQTSQLSNLVADLDQQLKKFQLLPTKVQEEIDALSDLQISRYLMNNDTVRYNEPACPIPKDGSLAADHLEVHFDNRWSHEPKISAPVGNGSDRVRGTIVDMLYQAQAECHSVRFPLKNKSTLKTVLASHSEKEPSESSSKTPAESYRASQFAVLLGNCQALNSAANHGRHQRRMPATDVYALHAAHSNVGGAAHRHHTSNGF